MKIKDEIFVKVIKDFTGIPKVFKNIKKGDIIIAFPKDACDGGMIRYYQTGTARINLKTSTTGWSDIPVIEYGKEMIDMENHDILHFDEIDTNMPIAMIDDTTYLIYGNKDSNNHKLITSYFAQWVSECRKELDKSVSASRIIIDTYPGMVAKFRNAFYPGDYVMENGINLRSEDICNQLSFENLETGDYLYEYPEYDIHLCKRPTIYRVGKIKRRFVFDIESGNHVSEIDLACFQEGKDPNDMDSYTHFHKILNEDGVVGDGVRHDVHVYNHYYNPERKFNEWHQNKLARLEGIYNDAKKDLKENTEKIKCLENIELIMDFN